ncbi:MAG: hypothetical protein IJF49_08380 [Clostridia bacterium]|nr:hypothetical protein [Clostridia bacterium]
MAKVGIENNGVFVGARSFPDRKKPCIVVERGNQCVVLGSFIDADRVDLFEQALRDMLKRSEKTDHD